MVDSKNNKVTTFQSTHPVRGGTTSTETLIGASTFQSTHPVRGGTAEMLQILIGNVISIHPPREGWDHRDA